jgi:hypothetical protein
MNGKQHGIGTFVNQGADPRSGEWKEGKRVRWLSSNEDAGNIDNN